MNVAYAVLELGRICRVERRYAERATSSNGACNGFSSPASVTGRAWRGTSLVWRRSSRAT